MRTDTTWRTLSESASILRVSERTIVRRVKAGRYPSHTVNGRVLVDVETDGSLEVAIVTEARAVSEDARRASALVAVALERVSIAETSIIHRLESDLRGQVNSRRTWSAVAIVGLCASVGLGFLLVRSTNHAGQLSDRMSDLMSGSTLQADRIAELQDSLSDRDRMVEFLMEIGIGQGVRQVSTADSWVE